MAIHDIVLAPPFNITRASHLVLDVTDLAVSRQFYTEAVGLIVSDEDGETIHLRGLEESCHHSLTLRRASGDARCARIGMRVQTDDDLSRAEQYLHTLGLEPEWVDVPFQGRSLHVRDAIGTPLELCAEMATAPRLMHDYRNYRGGSAQRLDHYQIVAQDVQAAYDFYTLLGFRLSEYTVGDTDDDLWGVWLQRKGNPHDIVFTNGHGPRLHHFAYTIRDAHDLIHFCDVAGSLGFGGRIERGPGRHGMGGGALFVYVRDPDGHRIELFNTHYQAIDIEPPLRWALSDPKRTDLWGMPATAAWFFEASLFDGVEPAPARLHANPRTLEKILSERAQIQQT